MSRIRNVRCVALSCFVASLFAAAIVPSSAYSQVPGGLIASSSARAPAAESEANIEFLLGQPTVVEVVEMPLEELLVTDLAERHALLIVLDKTAMEEAGVTRAMPVTWTLREVSLESALNLILGEHGLTWMIRDESLVITSVEAEANWTEARVYNVADLLANGESTDAFLGIVRLGLDRGKLRRADGGAAGGGLLGAAGGSAGAGPGAGGGRIAQDRPAESQDAGHSAAMYRDVLVVRDTQHRHRSLQRLLAEMREAKNAEGAPAAAR